MYYNNGLPDMKWYHWWVYTGGDILTQPVANVERIATYFEKKSHLTLNKMAGGQSENGNYVLYFFLLFYVNRKWMILTMAELKVTMLFIVLLIMSFH